MSINREARLSSAIAELKIEVYSSHFQSSLISAFANVYFVSSKTDDLYVAVKQLFAATGFILVELDEIKEVLLAGFEDKYINSQSKFIEHAIATGLASIGDLDRVAKKDVGVLPSPVHEQKFIESVVRETLKQRFLTLMPQFKTKGRSKLLNQLAHLEFLSSDPRIIKTDVSKVTTAQIANMLRSRGSQNICYVISENPAWDAKYWYLDTILENCVGAGYFVLMSCLPGHLYFTESEEVNTRSLISCTSA